MEVLPSDWRLKDMCVSKKNREGYDDPTAYEALTRIEQEQRALRAFRPIVYICSP